MLSTADKTLTANNGKASYQNTPVDVKIALPSLWVAMLFVFATSTSSPSSVLTS